MKAAPFSYVRAGSVAEACELLRRDGPDAKLIAGGQSLVPMMAMRLAVFGHLVDIGRIDELAHCEYGESEVRVGAGTTQAAIERDAELAATVPLLAKATPLIGHFQIRNRGTLGGSLAHADPAAEYPAVALTLDASLEAVSPSGRRTIPAREFFDGVWSTTLEADELLAAVRFPVWSGRSGFAVEEFARRHGDFAIAGATIAVELDGDDRVARCAIGLFGVGPTPLRASAAEAAVTGHAVDDTSPDEIGRMAVAGLESVPEDIHGSARYRTRVGAAMVTRAWTTAIREARNG
jgi:carbon-monoxide dehydrogenase medium subunit